MYNGSINLGKVTEFFIISLIELINTIWENEMKIREKYAIIDRLKLLMILFVLLFLLINLVYKLENKNNKVSTMEKFLQTAMEPVGTTMYIWGGGWDSEDTKSGEGSTRIGLSSTWKEFADRQDETYDFEMHKWERENGLDCSGYVGWVVYNTFETEDGQEGYVTSSTEMAKTYASWGWGNAITNPKEFLPGDIVSMDGHVWICLGTCEDGSVLLVHSSPPGVMMCGTQVLSQGGVNIKSIAIQLAEEYMSTYYPEWYEKYPNCSKSNTYLENVTVLRWNVTTLTDAKHFQNMSGEEVFQYLKSI